MRMLLIRALDAEDARLNGREREPPATAQIKSPEFLKAAIAQALGIGPEKDPKVAFAEAQQRLGVTEQRAKAAAATVLDLLHSSVISASASRPDEEK